MSLARGEDGSQLVPAGQVLDTTDQASVPNAGERYVEPLAVSGPSRDGLGATRAVQEAGARHAERPEDPGGGELAERDARNTVDELGQEHVAVVGVLVRRTRLCLQGGGGDTRARSAVLNRLRATIPAERSRSWPGGSPLVWARRWSTRTGLG